MKASRRSTFRMLMQPPIYTNINLRSCPTTRIRCAIQTSGCKQYFTYCYLCVKASTQWTISTYTKTTGEALQAWKSASQKPPPWQTYKNSRTTRWILDNKVVAKQRGVVCHSNFSLQAVLHISLTITDNTLNSGQQGFRCNLNFCLQVILHVVQYLSGKNELQSVGIYTIIFTYTRTT